MDVATSLVQAYLRINGYFTVTDYPLVEAMRGGPARSLTDIDMLAVRFGRHTSAPDGKRAGKVRGPLAIRTDRMLGCSDDVTDMIVAEVKQG